MSTGLFLTQLFGIIYIEAITKGRLGIYMITLIYGSYGYGKTTSVVDAISKDTKTKYIPFSSFPSRRPFRAKDKLFTPSPRQRSSILRC